MNEKNYSTSEETTTIREFLNYVVTAKQEKLEQFTIKNYNCHKTTHKAIFLETSISNCLFILIFVIEPS